MLYFCRMSLKRYLDRYSYYQLNAIKLSKSKEIGQELVQELFIILLEKDDKLLKRLVEENKAESYCLQIMKTQLYSKNSDFYKKEMRWRKNKTTIGLEEKLQDPFNEIDFLKMVDIEKVDLLIKRLPFFEREVFRVYYGYGLSLTKFSKQSGISRKTIYNTLQKVKSYIKDNYK